jgi:ABC-type molybdate transport system permease subunit
MMRAGLAAVDHSFENAARGLGAGEWRTFGRITLPLAWRGLLAAVLAGFARAFADFGATAIVASGAGNGWLLLPAAMAALAALYLGNRLRRGLSPA